MMNTLATVKNLSISFKNNGIINNAVEEINFEVEKGEIVAIVGESGSGKSITSLAMMQLLPKEAIIVGAIDFEGNNLLQQSKSDLQRLRGKEMAMIFQEPMTSLNPVLTCGEQVIEAIQVHQKKSKEEAKQLAIELFDKVQLPYPSQIINKYPHQLSGGQKQRVMIAMAICNNPKLLIADEPTTALDVTVQKNLLELLKQLQQQTGMSIIFITHDLSLVNEIANRVVVMYKGKIVEQGFVKDVLKNPQHEYTKKLLLCKPALYKKGDRLPTIDEDVSFVDVKNNTFNIVRSEVVLDVVDLKIYYSSAKKIIGKPTEPYKAVDGVSFKVNKGETIGLVGESGCGKTTLGRAILQLIPVTSGKIILNGQDVTHIKSKDLQSLRKDLQIVFQDPYSSLNPRIAIGDAIMEPLQVHNVYANKNERKDNVMALLEKVKLKPEHFNRYPHQFSGGQRQRICIARALALNPKFLIFDESVSALDVSVQAQVLNLLNDLKNEFAFTSIFISHDLSVVHYISDRIMVMQKGKIVEEDEADQIYFAPKHKYTQQLMEAIPGKKPIF